MKKICEILTSEFTSIFKEIGCDLTYPLFGFNEQLRYYRESPNQDFFRPTQKNLTHATHVKIMTHVKC